VVAVFACHTAIALEPFNRVGIQYFTPDISIIPGRVATDDMREIRAAVTWWNCFKRYTGVF
jgi:hypothetical protein